MTPTATSTPTINAINIQTPTDSSFESFSFDSPSSGGSASQPGEIVSDSVVLDTFTLVLYSSNYFPISSNIFQQVLTVTPKQITVDEFLSNLNTTPLKAEVQSVILYESCHM